jgi:hypothetical protein
MQNFANWRPRSHPPAREQPGQRILPEITRPRQESFPDRPQIRPRLLRFKACTAQGRHGHRRRCQGTSAIAHSRSVCKQKTPTPRMAVDVVIHDFMDPAATAFTRGDFFTAAAGTTLARSPARTTADTADPRSTRQRSGWQRAAAPCQHRIWQRNFGTFDEESGVTNAEYSCRRSRS